MTVAPSMLAASSTDFVSANRGAIPPHHLSPRDIGEGQACDEADYDDQQEGHDGAFEGPRPPQTRRRRAAASRLKHES